MTKRRGGRNIDRARKTWEMYNKERDFAKLVYQTKISEDERKVYRKEDEGVAEKKRKTSEDQSEGKRVYVAERNKAAEERRKMKKELEEHMGWRIDWEEYMEVMENEEIKTLEKGVCMLKEEVIKARKEKERVEAECAKKKKEEEKYRMEVDCVEKKKGETKKEDEQLKNIFSEMIVDVELVEWLTPSLKNYKLTPLDDDVLDIRPIYMDIEE